jgi:nucleoside-diphosphate-sugar epimerase
MPPASSIKRCVALMATAIAGARGYEACKMPIAVTGATGFLGSHIASTLRSRGIVTRGVVRNVSRGACLEALGVGLAAADLGDEPALAAAFSGARAVVANAALGSNLGNLDDFVRTNVAGTENTLRAAASAGVRRVVLISSVAVYRTQIRTFQGEDSPRYGHVKRSFVWSDLTTDWRYAMTKCIAEDRAMALARELDLQLTVLRPGPIYGSRDTRWTARLLGYHRRSVTVAPGVGVPMVHAGDVASAVAQALENPASVGRSYNLAGSPKTLPLMLAILRRLSGRGPLVLPIPLPLWVGYDTAAAARDLAFVARPLEEGLREVLAAQP